MIGDGAEWADIFQMNQSPLVVIWPTFELISNVSAG